MNHSIIFLGSGNMPKILVVDDDTDISELIALILKREQMEVIVRNDSSEALELLKNEHFDLILLDIMMPNLSGTELCGKIRDSVNSPIIFISAKNQLIDKMLGYEIGGDDYITKPFDNEELILKVKSHLRISNRINKQNRGDFIKIGDITLNTSSFEVKKSGERVDISTREFELLRYLMENAGQALSKEQIFASVWGSDYGDIGTVAVNIKSLRDKIDPDGKYIITIWGYGYKFIKECSYE